MKKLAGVCLVVISMLTSLTALGSETIVGVGMVLESKDNTIYVRDLIAGAPAARAGVNRGEIIIAVDSVSTLNQSLDFVVSRIRGEVGTSVTISFTNSDRQERNVTMIREIISTADTCFIVGTYSLRTNGFNNNPPTSIYGSIGDTSVNFFVNGNYVSGNIKGEPVSLNYNSGNNGSQESISGWIRGQHVNWYGNNNMLFGYQTCIK
ncbi:MAG: PDZ domain-containing protein [Oligoflexia bacterium]|nr:PDZ domain-containing protein [Oligoflexia bacterium]